MPEKTIVIEKSTGSEFLLLSKEPYKEEELTILRHYNCLDLYMIVGQKEFERDFKVTEQQVQA